MASLESGRRVLVVNDDASIRRLICHILTLDGFEIDQASDGTKALGLLEKSSYSLMITELEMKGFSGVDLILEARGRGIKFPILLISSSLGETIRDKLRATSRIEFLAKPFTLSAMRAAIEKVLSF